MSFVKLYSSIVDGTIMDVDVVTRLAFVLMLAIAEKDGVVDMTLPALSRRLNLPLDDVERAIGILASPDPHSRSPDEDGRRIIPLDPGRNWGWRITNYQKYRDSRDPDDRRAYKTAWQAKKRAKEKAVDSPVDSVDSPVDTPVDSVDCVDKSGPKQKEMQREIKIRGRGKETPPPPGGSGEKNPDPGEIRIPQSLAEVGLTVDLLRDRMTTMPGPAKPAASWKAELTLLAKLVPTYGAFVVDVYRLAIAGAWRTITPTIVIDRAKDRAELVAAGGATDYAKAAGNGDCGTCGEAVETPGLVMPTNCMRCDLAHYGPHNDPDDVSPLYVGYTYQLGDDGRPTGWTAP